MVWMSLFCCDPSKKLKANAVFQSVTGQLQQAGLFWASHSAPFWSFKLSKFRCSAIWFETWAPTLQGEVAKWARQREPRRAQKFDEEATKSFFLCACLIRHLVFSGSTLLLTVKSTTEAPLGRCSSWLPQVPVVGGAVKRCCFGILSPQTRPLLTASTLKGTKWGALVVTKNRVLPKRKGGVPNFSLDWGGRLWGPGPKQPWYWNALRCKRLWKKEKKFIYIYIYWFNFNITSQPKDTPWSTSWTSQGRSFQG